LDLSLSIAVFDFLRRIMEQPNQHKHHLIPLEVYIKTLLTLLVLTGVTVGVSYIDFGAYNMLVAMGIACLKASLVMMFFMGLKYDNWVNRAVILSSFVALGLFLFYSASDLWTRTGPTPVKVKAVLATMTTDELIKLATATPAQVAHGKELFANNCVACHGAEGKGDGASGASLNPKPRNFHAALSEWKNGNSPEAIYTTLAYGIPNSGMASYKALSPSDRWDLAHYVATFATGERANKAADHYAQAIKEDSSSGPVKTQVPVDFAIERIIQESK
jgi:caa(3)-type oxidase subunit IV